MPIGYTPRRKTPVKGRKFALSRKNEVLSNDIPLTSACVDASITVANSDANTSTITIQLKDANGNDIDFVETVELIVFATADGLAFATTGGSTGIAIGTDGALLAVVAKKYFIATSEADGDIDLTWTDTGLAETAFLGVRLPSGRIVMSDTLATA